MLPQTAALKVGDKQTGFIDSLSSALRVLTVLKKNKQANKQKTKEDRIKQHQVAVCMYM